MAAIGRPAVDHSTRNLDLMIQRLFITFIRCPDCGLLAVPVQAGVKLPCAWCAPHAV